MCGQSASGCEPSLANRCVEGMSHVMLVVLPQVLQVLDSGEECVSQAKSATMQFCYKSRVTDRFM